jgi:ACS family hexuronate transporter-like MFS transporter
MWATAIIIGIATAAHQAFSANLYTLPSDLFPKAQVGSVSGIGGTAGAIGGMLMAWLTGQVLSNTGSYAPLLTAAAVIYMVAVLVIHGLTPALRPVRISELSEGGKKDDASHR